MILWGRKPQSTGRFACLGSLCCLLDSDWDVKGSLPPPAYALASMAQMTQPTCFPFMWPFCLYGATCPSGSPSHVVSFHQGSLDPFMRLLHSTWTREKAVRPLNGWPWNSHDVACMALFWAKQVIRPSEIQGVGSIDFPFESGIRGKVTSQRECWHRSLTYWGPFWTGIAKAYPKTAP